MEILIVIVVILILTGIGAAVSTWAMASGKEAVTRTAVSVMQTVADEYIVTLGGSITGWSAGTGACTLLHHQTKSIARFQRYYATLPKQVYSFTGGVVDGWGRALYMVPGKVPYAGVPARSSHYIVSAGPDGNIATISDNIYSYAIIP